MLKHAHTDNNINKTIIIITIIIMMIIIIIIIIIIITIIIEGNTNLPPQGKNSFNTSNGGPTATVKDYEPSTVVGKTKALEVTRIVDPPHFYASATYLKFS